MVLQVAKDKRARPIVIFDVHGVIIGGDLVLEKPFELPGTRKLVSRLRKHYCVVAMTNVEPDMWPIWDSRYKITELFITCTGLEKWV